MVVEKREIKKGESFQPEDRSFKRFNFDGIAAAEPKTPIANMQRFDAIRKASEITDLPQFGAIQAPIMIKREDSDKPDDLEEDYAIHDNDG